eukprot:m.202427 g.202427  ORF g.202427 m.202427 type:complete len:312 (+) comp18829_c0_seq1:456-1391(+)
MHECTSSGTTHECSHTKSMKCRKYFMGSIYLWVTLAFLWQACVCVAAMEYPLEGIRLSSTHKLAFCAMHKNSMTTWTRLFMDLTVTDPTERKSMTLWPLWHKLCNLRREPCSTARISAGIPDQRLLQAPISDVAVTRRLTAILRNKEWIKVVALRDPVDRLLSGYLNWCVEYAPGSEFHKAHCLNFPDSKPTLEEFAATLVARGNAAANKHFAPQSMFCDLTHTAEFFDVVLNVSDNKYTAAARAVLRHSGVSDTIVDDYFALGEHSHKQSASSNSALVTPAVRMAAHQIYINDYRVMERMRSKVNRLPRA